MTRRPAWYRSGPALDAEPPAGLVRAPLGRRVRRWLRDRLPDPPVRNRTMVLYCRHGLRRHTAWPGMFSEFFSVLGALHYAESRGAAALRVEFTSPHYLDPERGPNWWLYFFERDVMPIAGRRSLGEVRLNSPLSKYGRYGGFSDRVHGAAPHMYPMTAGVPRAVLHRLLTSYIQPKAAIARKAEAVAAARLERGAFVIGVHYRGTDTARHFPFYRIPYDAYADEVRFALDAAAPSRFQIFVATDETDFVEFMCRAFPGRIVSLPDAPRVGPDDAPIHFNRTLAASGYTKGESALLDCLLLARSDYLVKGRSNLSDASLIVNARLPFSFCIG